MSGLNLVAARTLGGPFKNVHDLSVAHSVLLSKFEDAVGAAVLLTFSQSVEWLVNPTHEGINFRRQLQYFRQVLWAERTFSEQPIHPPES
jgi:hypothetical protein